MITISKVERGFSRFDLLGELYKSFYEGMSKQGLLIPLATNGELQWLESFKLRMGKLACIYIAENDFNLIGFSAGYIKLLPSYLGGIKVGFVDSIYVTPEYRKTGISNSLYNALESWLIEQKVNSIELQVLLGNKGGIEFWNKMGYSAELQQMRKIVK